MVPSYFGIGMYEGEKENVENNYNLDNFLIENLTLGTKGSVKMKVTFSLNKDCILTVIAEKKGMILKILKF